MFVSDQSNEISIKMTLRSKIFKLSSTVDVEELTHKLSPHDPNRD
ncbi:hypothetical protein CEV31_2672 [Brucella thiophenivorans]|uniref:Uncharacterized protein n=1 Tax=Brucella thiophenivorans TaxID=571255 RepID=A0A256FM50_9HYPH|nr:hypothetical protein CEV31_2672 [Brucella thiophenivorans]